MPPSTRPTDPPSIHPPAAFSCSHPEAHCGGSSVVKSARPPTTVGRSVGTLAHTRFLLRAARGKEEEEEEGRKVRCSRTQALRRRTYALPSLPPSPLPLRSLWGRRPPHNTARLKPYSARSPRRLLGRPDAEASSSSPPPSSLPPAARIWHRQMNSYSPSPSPRHRNGDRR